MSAWNDFNDAKPVANLIPKGTIVKVHMTIRPGGYDDHSQGWTGGYATSGNTGAVYLNAEFTVMEGPFAKRKIFTMIGLHSPKGPDWGNMGRAFIRSILNSARGISDKDNSPNAQAARRINGIADLDGLVFLGRIDVGKDVNGDEKNEIRAAVNPDHKDYAALMGPTSGGYAAPSARTATATANPQQQGQPQQPRPAATNRPSWAQ